MTNSKAKQNDLSQAGLSGKKVLITGGLGFIGSNLAYKCLEAGAEVAIYDCLDPRSGGNLYNVHDIRDSVKLIFHDIQDFGELTKAITGKDIIFNCAASTSHPFSMKEPWIDMDVNGRGVINILETIQRFNRDVKFVHVGTSTQLGVLQYQPADEKHPEFPTDIYSANKCVSEKYTMIYSKAYDINATVIRLSNVFGPRASIHSPDFTFNNFFVGLALQNKDITVYGEGKQLRNVIYIDDAVNALALASLSDKTAKNIFFAVGDNHYSVAQIAKETVKQLGEGKVRYIEWPKTRELIEVGDAIISNKKIKDILGWKPEIALIDGLIKTKEYFLPCMKEYFNKR